tara:strand:+ start:443 stop:664 length:222 start_codon:yes stop_codon:yes gene_type:complete
VIQVGSHLVVVVVHEVEAEQSEQPQVVVAPQEHQLPQKPPTPKNIRVVEVVVLDITVLVTPASVAPAVPASSS